MIKTQRAALVGGSDVGCEQINQSMGDLTKEKRVVIRENSDHKTITCSAHLTSQEN